MAGIVYLYDSGTVVYLNNDTVGTYGYTTIQNFRVQKSSNILTIPIPQQDSTYNIGMDLLGVTREFTISGIMSGTIAQIEGFVTILESFINGNQMERNGTA